MPRTCLSPDILLAFQQGQLSESEVDAVAEHLEECPSCVEIVQRLDDATDPFLDALRSSPATSSLPGGVGLSKRPNPDLMAPENWPRLPGYPVIGAIAQGGMGWSTSPDRNGSVGWWP